MGSRSENERSFGVTAYEAAEATSLAFRERALQYVFLPAASFDADDGGVQEIEPLVKAIRRHTSALVLAALHPPRTLRWIDHAYAIGVDGISFNLEVPNVPSLERLWPGRARYIGRSRYLQALRHAGKIFPRGTVWTELLLGACPVTELSELIEELISWNVLPFFVPTHPLSHSRTMPLAFSSSSDEATALLHQLQSLLLPNAPPRPWLPAWPHLLGPLDLPATEAARTNLTKRGCLKSRLELLAVRNLARLRRSLRVRCLAEHEYEGSG
ncbi:MAG: hypothetical protein N3C12_08800 [Candidatus Binatia bacterium]|nr:hypothetical protein [Candidatus Binatia bacterium]